jgi:hypothetical protein
MLSLFKSIFGTEPVEAGRYSEDLISRAIERAIDATDPRMRAVSGYARRLRSAVIRAIDYAVGLVGGMKPPVELTRQSYAADPRVAAIFASVEHMREVLARDPALTAFLREPGAAAAPRVYAMLVMEKKEKKVLGMELRGDVVQREVAQVSVNFGNYRLVDPALEPDELRRLLMRRVFDDLLALALARFTQSDELRAGLKRQRDLLRRKLKVLASGTWGFERHAPPDADEPGALEAKLVSIEERLATLPPDTETLSAHLDIVVDVLGSPNAQIWGARVPHTVDRMGIKREHPGATDLAFELGEIRSSGGHVVYVLPVSIVPSELPPPVDFFAEAARYLQ